MRAPSRSLLPLALLALAPTVLPAQGRTLAERLGYPANAKLLILHADDLGVAHSVDAASLDALSKGIVSSASVMMPTPWVTEVAAYAKANPDADLGLHLTLTSEWQSYRWGSVASRDQVPSLLDPDGTFPRDAATVVARARPAEVERELRAQLERALAMGIRPTHLDSHMGALFATPELLAAYVRVARDYQLPFLGMRALPGVTAGLFLDSDVLVDAVVIAHPQVPAEGWQAFYVDAVKTLKPGLTELIVHLGHDDAELQAVMVNHPDYGAAWRQRDLDALASPEFRQALKDHDVKVVTWRQIREAMTR